MTSKTFPHMTKRDMEKYKGLIVRQYRMDSQKGVINNWIRDLTFEWDLDSKIKRGCAELYYYTDGLKIKTLKSPSNKPYSDLDLYPTYKRPHVYSFMSKIAPLSEIIETINRYSSSAIHPADAHTKSNAANTRIIFFIIIYILQSIQSFHPWVFNPNIIHNSNTVFSSSNFFNSCLRADILLSISCNLLSSDQIRYNPFSGKRVKYPIFNGMVLGLSNTN